MSNRPTTRLEELLQHASWARRLARQLVGEAGADDLVQDAWLAALRRPPRAGSPSRPWLATVLRNRARMNFRGGARRREREERASREEALPSAAELTGRAESQRLLFDALLALEPEARKLVLLRFVDEWPVAEIARREGVAPSTVRDRLERGLGELRRQLEERRRDWALAMTPLLSPKHFVAAATSNGLLIMKVKLALSLAAALLILFGALDYLDWKPAEPGLALWPQSQPESLAALADLGRVPDVKALEGRGGRARETAALGAANADRASGLRLRFVDEAGAGVRGVQLSAGLPFAEGVPVSDASGRLVAGFGALPDTLETKVAWHHAAFASDELDVRLAPGEVVDRGDVVLHPGGGMRGRIVDRAGEPLAGLEVWCAGVESGVAGVHGRLGSSGTKSAADGSFELRGLLAGSVELSVESRDHYYWAESQRIIVRAGEVTGEVEIVANSTAPERTISGRVLSPEAEPVEHALVRASWKRTSSTLDGQIQAVSQGTQIAESDARGEFRLTLPEEALYELVVQSPAFEQWPAILVPSVEPGTGGLVLRFQEPRFCDVLIYGADGSPASSGRIDGVDGPESSAFTEIEEGHARIPIASQPVTLAFIVPGHLIERVGVLLPEELARRSAPLAVHLRASPGIRGEVRVRGQLAAKASVYLQSVATERVTQGALPVRFDTRANAWARTDSNGQFHLELRNAGRFVLRCMVEGFAACELGPFDIDPSVGLEDLVFEMTPGGEIDGRLSMQGPAVLRGSSSWPRGATAGPFTLTRMQADPLSSSIWRRVPGALRSRGHLPWRRSPTRHMSRPC